METRASNLPLPLTSFVGREHEAAEVRRLLSSGRLLTLVGAGGIGKTRLALAVAAGLRGEFPDGVWLVELAAITEPALVPQAVASAVGLREHPGASLPQTLADALRSKATLLVLDTCEHLIGPCAELAERLLGACPALRLMATSREPLGAAGETAWRVPPLSVPEPGRPLPAAELSRSEAVRLFVERAAAVLPGFALDERTGLALAELCRRLDGIPLALELAAAWVRTLSVEQIAARLDDRFRLLTGGRRTAPPRQQTLRGAIEWSYDLLGRNEQTLFDRLAVFAGAASLESVEAVCADDGIEERDVLPLLARLVDKSLALSEEQRGQRRYRLSETLRLFARERLVASGQAERAYRRHAAHYLALAEAAEPALWGPDLTDWLDRLEAEHDNLRAALRWSVGRGETEQALRLGAALCRFWQVRGHLSEGLRWLEGGLAWTSGASPVTRARALDAAGRLARERGDYERAAAFYDQSLALWRERGDRRGAALALNQLGVVAQLRNDIERAVALHEESLDLFRELGDEQGIGLSLLTLGTMAQFRGDATRATELCEEALACFRALGDERGIAASLNNLGNLASARDDPAAEEFYRESAGRFAALGDKREVAATLRNLAGLARDRGDQAQAAAHGRESLRIFAELGDRRGVAACLAGLARIAAAEGQPGRAVRLFGAAAAQEAGDDQPAPALPPPHDEPFAPLRTALGEDGFAAAWAAGTALPLEEAIAYALTPHSPTGSSPPARDAAPSALTPRQRDVAALIARGLTNREIAEELFIAERTVDTHVEHILAKLGLRSRAQVASWAVAHGAASTGAS